MDQTAAKKLAQDFYNAGLRSDQETFTITGSQEQIVVTITRTDSKPIEEGLMRLSKSAGSISPYGSGQVCGACGGTGRL
jgi:hypothetical protein